jgi:hypothetical protein
MLKIPVVHYLKLRYVCPSVGRCIPPHDFSSSFLFVFPCCICFSYICFFQHLQTQLYLVLNPYQIYMLTTFFAHAIRNEFMIMFAWFFEHSVIDIRRSLYDIQAMGLNITCRVFIKLFILICCI